MRHFRRVARALPGFYLFLVLFFIYLPVLIVVAFSFNQQPKGLMWTGFTTEWYGKLFANRQIMESFGNSLVVAGWSCLISALVGTLGAVGLSRAKLRTTALLEGLATLPIMIPEIVMGLALMTTFAALAIPRGMLTLVLAHSAFCIPYILLIVRARLSGLDPSYEEAARDLGAGPKRAFLTVIVPLIAPAIASGVLLAFAMSLDDVVISYYVAGAQSPTFPVYVYSKLKTNVPPSINAMATITLGVTFLAVALSRGLKGAQDSAKRKRHGKDGAGAARELASGEPIERLNDAG
ncbi:MAG: ABC transporter permease [Clostridia bacterium]